MAVKGVRSRVPNLTINNEPEKLSMHNILSHYATINPVKLDSFPNTYASGVLISALIILAGTMVHLSILLINNLLPLNIITAICTAVKFLLLVLITNLVCILMCRFNAWLIGRSSSAREHALYTSSMLYYPLTILSGLFFGFWNTIVLFALVMINSYYIFRCYSLNDEFLDKPEDVAVKVNIAVFLEVFTIIHLYAYLINLTLFIFPGDGT